MNDSPEDIINKIKEVANSAPTAHDKPVPEALYHFARYIEDVAKSAKTQTDKVIHLTWALFGLTVALFVVALIQLKIMWNQDTEAHDHGENTCTDCNHQPE